MIYLYVRQTVADYARWKEAFDMQSAARQAGGATAEAFVLRNVEDPSEIILVLGWCDLARAQLFVQSVSWEMARRQKGVISVSEVLFLAEMP